MTDAAERYYMDTGDWPRLNDELYTAEEVHAKGAIYSFDGKAVTLDEEGNYYDIDYSKLSKYANINSDISNFILQNPVGDVYFINSGNKKTDKPTITPKINNKPIAVITISPDSLITPSTIITWSYADSIDPDGGRNNQC